MDNRDRHDFWNSSNVDDYFSSTGSINSTGQNFHNPSNSAPAARGDASSSFGNYLGINITKSNSYPPLTLPQSERLSQGFRENTNDYDLDDFNDQYYDDGYDSNPPTWVDAPLSPTYSALSQESRFLPIPNDNSFNQYPGSSMHRLDESGFPPQVRMNQGNNMDIMNPPGNFGSSMAPMSVPMQSHGHFSREHDVHMNMGVPVINQTVRYKPNIPNPAPPPVSQQHFVYQQQGLQHHMYQNPPPHVTGGHIMSSMNRGGPYALPPRGVIIPPRPPINVGPYGRMQANQVMGGISTSSIPGTGGSNAQGRAINKMLLDVLRSRIVDPNRLALIVDANIERMDCVNLATLLFHTGKKRLLLTPLFIKRIATRFSLLKEELRAREASNALYGLKCMSSDAPEVRQLILALAHKVSLSSSDLVAQAVGNAMLVFIFIFIHLFVLLLLPCRYGCQMMTSDYEEVRFLLQVLAVKVLKCTELLEAQNVGNAL